MAERQSDPAKDPQKRVPRIRGERHSALTAKK
jgi:hypothetical protein